MSKTVAICSSRKANPQPQQEILLLDATGWFKGESKRRSRQKRRHAALGRHRKVESDATATAGVCALRHSRGLQFFASKSGHRFDPDHIHQPNQCEGAWREHYGVRYLKGFKTATSKCAKSRSFRVATVRP